MKSCFVIKMLSLDLLLKLPLSTLLVIFAELMILGFISLLLTFGQNYIIQICIPEEAADTMLPCLKEGKEETIEGEGHRRRLLWSSLEGFGSKHRMLVEASSSPHCPEVSAYAQFVPIKLHTCFLQ